MSSAWIIRLIRLECMLFSLEAPILSTILTFCAISVLCTQSMRIDYFSPLLAVKQLYNVFDQMEGVFMVGYFTCVSDSFELVY